MAALETIPHRDRFMAARVACLFSTVSSPISDFGHGKVESGAPPFIDFLSFFTGFAGFCHGRSHVAHFFGCLAEAMVALGHGAGGAAGTDCG